MFESSDQLRIVISKIGVVETCPSVQYNWDNNCVLFSIIYVGVIAFTQKILA